MVEGKLSPEQEFAMYGVAANRYLPVCSSSHSCIIATLSSLCSVSSSAIYATKKIYHF